MCGRRSLHSDGELVADEHDLPEVPSLTPRYNIAPTQVSAVVARQADSTVRGLGFIRWGLVPYWANDTTGPPLVNVRAETVAGKFSLQFRERRCLMPGDGFYEWVAVGRKKCARYFTLTDRVVFSFAAIWDVWEGRGDGKKLVSAALVTTTPNDLVATAHDRMPVILPRAAYDEWLDPDTPEKRLKELLVPYPVELMAVREVGPLVNSPQNEGPACLEAA